MNQGELRQISCKDLLRFYFWWFTKEEKICIDFNNESKKSAALYQYLKYMKIARNFKKNNPDNIFLAASRIFNDNKNEDKGKIINLLSEEFSRCAQKFLPQIGNSFFRCYEVKSFSWPLI